MSTEGKREFYIDEINGVIENWEAHWEGVPRDEGQFHVIEKVAYDAVVKEREKWKAHYDVKQGVCEELIKEIGEKNVEIELLRTTKSAMSDVLDSKDQEIQRLREALEFFANEQLYKMSSFQTASPIHDVDKPTNITVNENPILYLGLEKARIALNPGSKGGG